MEVCKAEAGREGGGRVSTNVMVRDMDVSSVGVGDSRRREIVVDGHWPLTQLLCLR